MIRKMLKSLVLLTGLATSLPVIAQQATDSISPEAAVALEARNSGKPVHAKKWMVAVANPLAAQAAANVLRRGGNAIDAAIAAQAMLGLVEPQSSGLGGGAFLVYFDAKTNSLTTLDGRETAPMAATPQLFQDENGEPLKFFDAVVGGRSVGVPGTPALLQEMHKRWGKADWKTLFDPAIETAVAGFKVSPRLAGLMGSDAARLLSQPGTAAYFFADGKPLPAGSILKNEAYASSLRTLQANPADFYTGKAAQAIVTAVRGVANNPGVLSEADLAIYTVKERPPVCVVYLAREVCGMGPPSSGALTVGQILGMLAPAGFEATPPNSTAAWQIIGDASRLAFADRGRYMADSDFVPMPTKGLLAPDYLKTRGELISGGTRLEEAGPGDPAWDHAQLQADDQSLELPSTTHFSIVDGEGNAVSMTSTIENGFGSRVMVNGYLLNNELTDFSFKSHSNGIPIANRVEPGKRPRSSMAPTIVMKDSKPELIVGSPGGSRIIGYVAKTIIAHYAWGMDIQQAISSPHVINRFGTFDLEEGTDATKLAPDFEALGYEVNIRGLTSGLHAILITENGLQGGADPRREGIVLGE